MQKGAKDLNQPFKKSKTHLSTSCSELIATADKEIVSNDGHTATIGDDNTLTVPGNPSDIEIMNVDPEKEHGSSIYCLHHNCLTHKHLQKIWKWLGILQYSFFKSDGISIQYHDGCLCHFFPCAALKCKTTIGGVCCFQDSKDKS